jgi:hypothetical protein
VKVWGGSPSTGGFDATRASKTQNRTSLGTVLEAQTAWAFGIILARLFSARRIRGDDEFRIVRVHRQRAGNDDLARQIACVIQYILEAENGSRSTWLGSPTLGNRPLLRTYAFSRSPLSRAFRPFIRPISNGRKGSICPVRQAIGGWPLFALTGRLESTNCVEKLRLIEASGADSLLLGCRRFGR